MVAANPGSGSIFDRDRDPSKKPGVNIRIRPDSLAEIRRLAARSEVSQTAYLERIIDVLSLIDGRIDGCPLAAIEAFVGIGVSHPTWNIP